MPKVKNLKPDPPVDLLLAVLLERKQVKKYSFEDLAALTGFSRIYLVNLFKRSPWDWPPETRRTVCSVLAVPEHFIRETAR